MAFYGLFIGINRHSSTLINELSFAARDAAALHALFTDTLGGATKLIVDEEATRATIIDNLEKLKSCSAADVVVISFSGHGSPTHQIVTYDADLRDLEGSCISLDLLARSLSQVPAKRLICILDCCFSGGMGAKGLDVDTTARELSSVENLLEQMSGAGRLVLTASTATEKAWENAKLKHGLLTHHLIMALQGADEVVQAGKISLYRLLEHVTKGVTDFSAKLGKIQNPTVRGKIDGDITWPIFTPGPRYSALFPDSQRQPVTKDVQSLNSYGFPQQLIDAWAGVIPSLNELQISAVNEYGLLSGENLVVSAPTSSGKTTVDDIGPLMRGQYDICLMTYEKFAALALGSPYLMGQVGTVVVDEVQMIADLSRGANLEFLLTLLRISRRQGAEPQFIALSAVIGDTNGLERWVGARLLKRTERPVPLDEGVIRRDGSFRFVSSDTGEEKILEGVIVPEYRSANPNASQNYIIPLTRKLVSENKSVIVFRETKGEARGCAHYLAEALRLPPAKSAIDLLPIGDPSLASGNLKQSLEGGVAFHIADLDPEEKQVIEDEFRLPQSSIRVIAATTTLAMGINTPAEAVIIAGLEHPGAVPQPYSIAEYKNIAGRAGRLPFTQRGASFLLALTARAEEYLWTRYIKGQPEDVVSRFLSGQTDQRSLILRVLAATPKKAGGLTSDQVISFLEESFGAFQQRQMQPNWSWDKTRLLEALLSLKTHGLVEVGHDGRYLPTDLGRFAGEAGVEVESIIRLVDAFRRVRPEQVTDPALITAAQITVELDEVYFPVNKKGAAKESNSWTSEIRRQGVTESLIQTLSLRVSDTAQLARRAKKAAACLLWISDLPMSEIENILTRHGGRFDGASGPVLGSRSRTCDLLHTVSRVAAAVHPSLDLNGRVDRLLIRLETGVPPTAVELATLAGTRLTRGDYRRLLQAGKCSIDELMETSDEALLEVLSGSESKLLVLRRAVEAHNKEHDGEASSVQNIPLYVS